MRYIVLFISLILSVQANSQTTCNAADNTYRKAATKQDDSLFHLVKRHVETTEKPTLDTLTFYADISETTDHLQDKLNAYELADRLFAPSHYIKSRLGSIYLARNETDKAYRYYNAAYRLNPHNLQTNHQLALLELQFGDTAAAISVLKSAMHLFTECNHDYYLLGEIYRSLGQYDSAIKYFSFFTEAKGSQTPYMWRGLCYLEQKDYTRAMADFEREMELYPENGYAFYYAGVAQLRQDYSIIAISYFERAAEFWDTKASAYYLMGTCYEKLDRRRKAEKCYERVLIVNPKHADAALRLKLLKHKK